MTWRPHDHPLHIPQASFVVTVVRIWGWAILVLEIDLMSVKNWFYCKKYQFFGCNELHRIKNAEAKSVRDWIDFKLLSFVSTFHIWGKHSSFAGKCWFNLFFSFKLKETVLYYFFFLLSVKTNTKFIFLAETKCIYGEQNYNFCYKNYKSYFKYNFLYKTDIVPVMYLLHRPWQWRSWTHALPCWGCCLMDFCGKLAVLWFLCLWFGVCWCS